MPPTTVVGLDRSADRTTGAPTDAVAPTADAAAVPAADDGTTQTVQLSILAGSFTTSVAPGAELVVLRPGVAASTGTLPRLTVVNALGDGAGWSSVGRVGDFRGLSGAPCPAAECIPAGQLGWTPSTAELSGGGAQVLPGPTVSPGSSVLGGVGATLCSVPQGGGGGTFACDATLALAVPPGTAPGDYAAVLSLDTVNGAVATSSDVVLTTRVGTAGIPVVPQGGAIDVAGGGFQTGTTVTITLHSTPVVLTTTTADAAGRFAVTVTIPADTPTGTHRLVATGVGADGLPHAVALTIEVVPVGTVVPPPVTTPPTGPPAPETPEVLGTQELPSAAKGSVTPVADESPAPTGSTTTAPKAVGPDELADAPGVDDRAATDDGGTASTAWWLVLVATAGLGIVVVFVVRRRREPA